MAAASDVRGEVEELIRRLVDQPEKVKVAEFPSGDEILLEVEVAPEDLGKVIGRQGRTVRALRTLLETRNAREAIPYGLEIIED